MKRNDIPTMIWQKYYNLEHQYGPHSWQSHCMSKSANVHTIEKLIKDNNLTCPANIGYKEKY
jgi:hypothetical protein